MHRQFLLGFQYVLARVLLILAGVHRLSRVRLMMSVHVNLNTPVVAINSQSASLRFFGPNIPDFLGVLLIIFTTSATLSD
jgi:hypothetical protein